MQSAKLKAILLTPVTNIKILKIQIKFVQGHKKRTVDMIEK